MDGTTVVLSGATGNLGGRIARALLRKRAKLRVMVRRGAAPDKVEELRRLGADAVEVDFGNADDMTGACAGGSCVVSALSGLRNVIVEAQTSLLDAAVRARVPRFIPSDYAIDFTKVRPGTNRNLDLRREFQARLDAAPVSPTSILNGMFADLLTGQAPMILFRLRRVVYWEDPDIRLDFTTADNVAEFTASAALDASTPRFLRIAGDRVSASELAKVASQVTGSKFSLLRAGGLGRLEVLIRVTRAVLPQKNVIYPPWQGMQYMHNMFSGQARLDPLDNGRYPDMRWTSVRDVLAAGNVRAARNSR